MDHGEQPEETLVREVFEETGLQVSGPKLIHAQSYSESSRGPYLAVQLIYRVSVEGTPRVMEEGGTTAAVAWVPLEQMASLPTVPFVAEVLQRLSTSSDS